MTEPEAAPPRPLAHVALVEPEIHWNTGNAGRTCLALGAKLHLVEPLGFSLDEAKVKRAGLDYWQRVAPTVWPSWTHLETRLPDMGEAFFFSAEAEVELWSASFPEHPVLVFGRESVGLPRDLRRRYADRLLRIPMARESVRSLNLSTSVAVVLYEVMRQRRAQLALPAGLGVPPTRDP